MENNENLSKYRGVLIDEVKKMSLDDFSKLLTSRHRRKLKRGLTEEEQKLMDKINKGKKKLRTHCRDMIVVPNMLDKKIEIYNGKTFAPVLISNEMLGYRLGEFAPTRKIGVKHSGKAAGGKTADKK